MRDLIQLLEDKAKPQDIEIIQLNFEPSEVSPVLSKDTPEYTSAKKNEIVYSSKEYYN